MNAEPASLPKFRLSTDFVRDRFRSCGSIVRIKRTAEITETPEVESAWSQAVVVQDHSPEFLLSTSQSANGWVNDDISSNVELAAFLEEAPAGAPFELPNTIPDGRLLLETDDGAFSYQFDGRVLLDAAFYSEGRNPLAGGTEVRDARAGIKARLHRDWRAELDINFENNEVEFKDAWIAYTGLDSSFVETFLPRFPIRESRCTLADRPRQSTAHK